MSLFELVTGVIPVDCIENDNIYFVVPKKDLKTVFSNRGEKLKILNKHTGKNIIIFPYCDTKEEFIEEVISHKVKIKDSNDSLKLFVNRQDTRKIRKDIQAIKTFLERIYNVENVLFRW
jgi:transcription antitermination factor NusA-like protein